MVAAEPRNRSNGHVLKKDVQTPPADAPDAAPDDTDGEDAGLRGSTLLGAFVEAPSHAAGEADGAGGDEASSTDTPLPRPAPTEGNGADAGKQWYSDEELAHWIADSVGRDGGHSPRRRVDWRWLLYMVVVGPFLLVGLVFAAIARLLLPSRVPVWGFRRRMAALRYLLAVGVLAGIVVVAVLLVFNDGLPFRSPAADSSVGQVVVPPAQQQTQAPAKTAEGAPPAAAQAPAASTAVQQQTDAPAQQQTQAPAATAVVAPPAAAQAPVVETAAQPATDTAAQPAATAVAATTVTTPAVLPTVVTSPAPVAQPAASPAAAPAIEWVVVANSGGTGVFLRPEPAWAARWRAEPGATQREGAYPHHGNIAWREGTSLQVRGPEVTGTGPQPSSSEAWMPVRDPVGREGFMPTRYLQRVEAAALVVPTAAPSVGDTGQAAVQLVVVTGTNGTGIFLRPRPEWTARWPAAAGETKEQGAWGHHGWVAWLEGTRLQVRGPEVTGTGPQPGSSEAWVPVRDPVGREGFLPARHLRRMVAAGQFVVVAGTDGTGVFLRPRPEWAARWLAAAGETKEQGAWGHHGNIAWLEGTRLQVRGLEVTGAGPQPGSSEAWVPVRDPVGRDGFVPARYVEPAG